MTTIVDHNRWDVKSRRTLPTITFCYITRQLIVNYCIKVDLTLKRNVTCSYLTYSNDLYQTFPRYRFFHVALR